MRNKLLAVLGRILLLLLLISPFLYAYYFFTDPVHAIAYTIGAWLWLIVVVIPLFLIAVIGWGIFSVFFGLLRSIYELIKSLFK